MGAILATEENNMRGGPVFSRYYDSMKTCWDCKNPDMELLKSGGFNSPDIFRCQRCGKVYERDSCAQLAKDAGGLWWKIVKFMYGITK